MRRAGSIGAATGSIGVLVNNAGVMRVGPFESIAPEDAEQQIRVNFLGVVNTIYAFFKQLKATLGARIINLASASAIYGRRISPSIRRRSLPFAGLTEALEIEFRRHDIRACSLSPPLVATQLVSD